MINKSSNRTSKIIFLILFVFSIVISVTAVGIQQYDSDVYNQQNLNDLWEYLAIRDVPADLYDDYPDMNGDGILNLKDITLLQRRLNEDGNAESGNPLADDLRQYEFIHTSTSDNGVICTSFRFGQSVQGRDLICWSIQQGEFTRTVLLNFAIHGWEDSYAADGQLLVDLGNALVDHYSKIYDLQNCRLLIVPCANPDGLAEGTTNNGFGRCNADGIDLNRDFDASHVVYTNSRNYTPAPFSGAESRALRDLVLASTPDVVVDFHGWLNYTIGNSELAEVFSTYVGIQHNYELTTGSHGFFSYWAQLQGAEAILVEFKDTTSIVTEDVILAVDQLIAENYGNRQHNYPLNENFTQFESVVAYGLGTGRIYTQKQVGDTGTEYGYIVGGVDTCTVLQIYSNGWCKVNYSIGELTKTGYCQLSAFIPVDFSVTPYTAQSVKNTSVFSSPECSNEIGSVWNTDVFTVVAVKEGVAEIIYPIDGGGYKMGWIDAATILDK